MPTIVNPTNVTMGVTLTNTPVTALIELIFEMQKTIKWINGEPNFYFRSIEPVLTHKYVIAFDFVGISEMLQMMKENNVPPLDFMLHLSRFDGVKFIACLMSMSVMGLTCDELIDGVDIGGVGSMLEYARKSSINYCI